MAFDEAAYLAKIQEYMQQMAQSAGYKTGQTVAPIVQQQPGQPNPLVNSAQNALKGYLQRQAFASQAPSAIASGLPQAPLAANPEISSGLMESLNSQLAGPTLANAPASVSTFSPLGTAAAAPLAIMTAIKSAQALKNIKKGNDLSGMQAAAMVPTTMGASLLYNPIKNYFHKSIRDVQKGVTSDLMSMANTPAGQAYVQGMRAQFGAPSLVDPSKPFDNGQYGSWDEYKKAGLQASDLTGVEGNMKVYTPDVWAGLSQQQRQAITQKNIDSGIYTSKKGGVQITDEAQALKNKDAILASMKK